jgi:hypothetical protein
VRTSLGVEDLSDYVEEQAAVFIGDEIREAARAVGSLAFMEKPYRGIGVTPRRQEHSPAAGKAEADVSIEIRETCSSRDVDEERAVGDRALRRVPKRLRNRLADDLSRRAGRRPEERHESLESGAGKPRLRRTEHMECAAGETLQEFMDSGSGIIHCLNRDHVAGGAVDISWFPAPAAVGVGSAPQKEGIQAQDRGSQLVPLETVEVVPRAVGIAAENDEVGRLELQQFVLISRRERRPGALTKCPSHCRDVDFVAIVPEDLDQGIVSTRATRR